MRAFLGTLVHPQHSLRSEIACVSVELLLIPSLLLSEQCTGDEAVAGGQTEEKAEAGSQLDRHCAHVLAIDD